MKKETKSRPLLPEDTERDKSGKPKRYNYFAFLLYPDCPEHLKILEYVRGYLSDIMDVAWILHDRDRWSDDVFEGDQLLHKKGDVKKPHYHVVYRPNTSTVAGQIKFWGGLLDKVVGVENIQGQMIYLLHKDFPSKLNEFKAEYSPDELHCSDKWKAYVVVQNSHFVELSDLVDIIDRSPHGTVGDLVRHLSCTLPFDTLENSSHTMQTLRQYQGLICTHSNQVHGIRKSLALDGCADILDTETHEKIYENIKKMNKLKEDLINDLD